MPVTQNPTRRKRANDPSRLGANAQRFELNNPAWQSNSKVGSRYNVERNLATYTWKRKSEGGLSAREIQALPILGSRGDFNVRPISKIVPGENGEEPNIEYGNPNQRKVRYKSKKASEGALKRNNWVVYVQTALQAANVMLNVPLKYPEVISDAVLQAMYHAESTNDNGEDVPNPISPYLYVMTNSRRTSDYIIEVQNSISDNENYFTVNRDQVMRDWSDYCNRTGVDEQRGIDAWGRFDDHGNDLRNFIIERQNMIRNNTIVNPSQRKINAPSPTVFPGAPTGPIGRGRGPRRNPTSRTDDDSFDINSLVNRIGAGSNQTTRRRATEPRLRIGAQDDDDDNNGFDTTGDFGDTAGRLGDTTNSNQPVATQTQQTVPVQSSPIQPPALANTTLNQNNMIVAQYQPSGRRVNYMAKGDDFKKLINMSDDSRVTSFIMLVDDTFIDLYKNSQPPNVTRTMFFSPNPIDNGFYIGERVEKFKTSLNKSINGDARKFEVIDPPFIYGVFSTLFAFLSYGKFTSIENKSFIKPMFITFKGNQAIPSYKNLLTFKYSYSVRIFQNKQPLITLITIHRKDSGGVEVILDHVFDPAKANLDALLNPVVEEINTWVDKIKATNTDLYPPGSNIEIRSRYRVEVNAPFSVSQYALMIFYKIIEGDRDSFDTNITEYQSNIFVFNAYCIMKYFATTGSKFSILPNYKTPAPSGSRKNVLLEAIIFDILPDRPSTRSTSRNTNTQPSLVRPTPTPRGKVTSKKQPVKTTTKSKKRPLETTTESRKSTRQRKPNPRYND
jgi:hypothetical protein